MGWQETRKHLGEIKVGSINIVSFKFEGDIEILKYPNKEFILIPSCGCTSPKWDIKNKTVTIEYKAKDIPLHLKQEGKTEYVSYNYVYVEYISEGQKHDIKLEITATVKSKL